MPDITDRVFGARFNRKSIVKKLPGRGIIAVAALFTIIIFAFIWEAKFLPRNDDSKRRNEHYPPPARSEIQDRLNGLGWVRQEFIPINDYSRPGTLVGEINGIVIHYVGNPNTTAMQNRNYFANLSVTNDRYASSNFIVGLEGEVIQCVPVDEIAYASNNRNADTISIEMCHPDDSGAFNEDTYTSAVVLTAWLCNEYGLGTDSIIRHYDVTGKICPKFFVDDEDAWEAFKKDVIIQLSSSGNGV